MCTALQCNVINACAYTANIGNIDPNCQAFGRPRRLLTRSLWMMTASTNTRILASSVLIFGRWDWPCFHLWSLKRHHQSSVTNACSRLSWCFEISISIFVGFFVPPWILILSDQVWLLSRVPGEGQHHFWRLGLFEVVYDFPTGKSTIWGIYIYVCVCVKTYYYQC